MNVDGSDSRKLFSAGSELESFAMSPDDKRLRYFKGSSLWEATAQGTNPHQLLRDWKSSGHMCCGTWSPDGSMFAFVAAPRRQLWALDERRSWWHKPSGQPVALSSSPTEWGSPVFSKDGKKIFATGSTLHGDWFGWMGTRSPFLAGISANLLSFSKDGQTVAYVTYPDDSFWTSKVDGWDAFSSWILRCARSQ